MNLKDIFFDRNHFLHPFTMTSRSIPSIRAYMTTTDKIASISIAIFTGIVGFAITGSIAVGAIAGIVYFYVMTAARKKVLKKDIEKLEKIFEDLDKSFAKIKEDLDKSFDKIKEESNRTFKIFENFDYKIKKLDVQNF